MFDNPAIVLGAITGLILVVIVCSIVAYQLAKAKGEARREKDASEASQERIAEQQTRIEEQQVAIEDATKSADEEKAARQAAQEDAERYRATAAKRAETLSRDDGYIYVVSNAASFSSDEVFKIGMTRVDDPHSRVAKGNTYVPFRFVVNILLLVPNVAEVEKLMHEKLHGHRMNHAKRNEFFHVPFDVVVDALNEIVPGANYEILDRSPVQRDYIAMNPANDGG